MRKRLLKKKKLGPFREFAFVVALYADDAGDSESGAYDFDAMFDALRGFLAERGMRAEGDADENNRVCMVVELGPAGDRCHALRIETLQWLLDRPELAKVRAGPVVDINHPPAGWLNPKSLKTIRFEGREAGA